MPTTTTGSLNIAVLEAAVLSNLCDGIFAVNITPSIFIGSGANNVRGASVQIVNPYGVTIRYYPTSGYDIYPPMTSTVEVSIPTQANNYQYGTYQVSVQLTDANGTIYTVTKAVKICAPNPKNKNVNYGSLSAQLNGNCSSGKVTVIADTAPTYQGSESDNQDNAFTLEYPTSSGKDVLSTSIGSFSATLFEGVYKFNGTICAHYDLGDYLYAEVNYKVKREKYIRCLLDKGCVAANLAELQSHILSDCSDAEKIATQNKIINALLLLQVIDGLANSGQDASDYITQLEKILGCTCTCNCAEGTPIINNNPSTDIAITGCGFEVEVADLTTTYTLNNYAYIVTVTDNGGAITITTPTLDECIQTQTITFNVDVVYEQIKNQINTEEEYAFWGTIINSNLDDIDISCLPITQLAWDIASIDERIQAIIAGACAGGTCEAEIATAVLSTVGADVLISWTNVIGGLEVVAYLDGISKGSVLYSGNSFTFEGAADGTQHVYALLSRCSNGSIGNALQGAFTYFGCAAIAPPTVTSNSVTADCPYDLTALQNSLPAGITAEWHSAYNTLASTLVDDPTAVSGGVYYVYGKDSSNCYSALATRVVLTCTEATACSAPQNLIVESIMGGFRVRFQSAAYPPPSNSYTVKRRLKSDPDISGSYTTIGTPTYNAGAARWEILDAPGTNNQLYTYRAISNCSSTSPYVDYDFANITCPVVTLTPNTSTMGYSFTNVGGAVDKYEVSIYESNLTTLIHTDTVIPAFTSPITGTFVYLSSGSTYGVKVRVFIGTYYHDCPITTAGTIAPSFSQISNTNTGPGGTRTQIAQVGASVTAGNVYTATVYSHPITYTAIFGDTPTTVAIAIRDLINGTSEAAWGPSAPLSGTTGFPPVATASGDQLTAVLNYQNAFFFFATA